MIEADNISVGFKGQWKNICPAYFGLHFELSPEILSIIFPIFLLQRSVRLRLKSLEAEPEIRFSRKVIFWGSTLRRKGWKEQVRAREENSARERSWLEPSCSLDTQNTNCTMDLFPPCRKGLPFSTPSSVCHRPLAGRVCVCVCQGVIHTAETFNQGKGKLWVFSSQYSQWWGCGGHGSASLVEGYWEHLL